MKKKFVIFIILMLNLLNTSQTHAKRKKSKNKKNFLTFCATRPIIKKKNKPSIQEYQNNNQKIFTEKVYENKILNTIYQEKFKDVLLVIHFNQTFYNNIPFLKELYSPIFKNIVFYGEKKHPEVFDVHSNFGWFVSGVIQDILTRFPDYKGYLILQDDCIINFWNLINFDQDKIWYASTFNSTGGMNIADANATNHEKWWLRKFDDQSTTFSQLKKAYDALNSEEKNILELNLGKDKLPSHACDFFYIPKKFSYKILELSKIFDHVFCEAAIPTMLFCLDSKNNFEEMKMYWGIGEPWTNIPALNENNYPKNIHWLHPVKFSNQKNQELIKKIFDQFLYK